MINLYNLNHSYVQINYRFISFIYNLHHINSFVMSHLNDQFKTEIKRLNFIYLYL